MIDFSELLEVSPIPQPESVFINVYEDHSGKQHFSGPRKTTSNVKWVNVSGVPARLILRIKITPKRDNRYLQALLHDLVNLRKPRKTKTSHRRAA